MMVSDVSGLVVGVNSGGILVDKLVVLSVVVITVCAQDTVLVINGELVGELIVTESVVLERLIVLQVPRGV